MYQKNFGLSNYTTYKIGGSASYFIICNTLEEIQNVFSWCKERRLPWFIIGNGSNILVSDDGFPGMVIKLGRDFKNVSFGEGCVETGGALLLPAFSRHLLARGWGGFEFMCGVPGTIGGAVRMNAGTGKGEIQDHFISATVLAPDGEIRTISKAEMCFSHRTSLLAGIRDVVLSAKFKLNRPEKPEHIKEKIKRIIADRRERQPGIKRNCGSVFKNPPGGKPAGWYIEHAGLKGVRVGDAMVAHEHANWIINPGNATARHIKDLIARIQDEVFQKFGVFLERELIYVPEDIVSD